jgi:hypothetical protein
VHVVIKSKYRKMRNALSARILTYSIQERDCLVLVVQLGELSELISERHCFLSL